MFRDVGMVCCTVEPLNKGHIGGNVNSAVLSFRRSKYTNTIGHVIFGTSFVERFIIQCPI